MKQFLEPEMKVEMFCVEDILTTSVVVPGEKDPEPGIDGTPIG